jgi:hypothetical protein
MPELLQQIESIVVRALHGEENGVEVKLLSGSREVANVPVAPRQAQLFMVAFVQALRQLPLHTCDRAQVLVERAERLGWIQRRHAEEFRMWLRMALDMEVVAGGPYRGPSIEAIARKITADRSEPNRIETSMGEMRRRVAQLETIVGEAIRSEDLKRETPGVSKDVGALSEKLLAICRSRRGVLERIVTRYWAQARAPTFLSSDPNQVRAHELDAALNEIERAAIDHYRATGTYPGEQPQPRQADRAEEPGWLHTARAYLAGASQCGLGANAGCRADLALAVLDDLERRESTCQVRAILAMLSGQTPAPSSPANSDAHSECSTGVPESDLDPGSSP